MSAAFVAMQGSSVPAPAKLVLLRMAHTARDADRPPQYWYGWEALALSIGYTPEEIDGTARDSIRRHVRRLVKALHDDRLLERVDEQGNPIAGGSNARIGHRQIYALRIYEARQGVISDPPPPDTSDPPGGGSRTSAVGDISDPPKDYSGELRGRAPGQLPSVDASSHQRAGEDGDAEYEAAHGVIERADPERAQLAREVVHALHRNLNPRQAVVLTARQLQGGAA